MRMTCCMLESMRGLGDERAAPSVAEPRTSGAFFGSVERSDFRQSFREALYQATALGASVLVLLVLTYWTFVFWWLYLPGLVLVPVVVGITTRRRPIKSPLTFFVFLPLFAYIIGVLANCLAFTVMGAESFCWTLSSAAPADEKLYGLYGIPAATFLVLCVLRYCIPLVVRAAQKTQRRANAPDASK